MLLFLLRTTTVRYLFSVEHFRLFYELAGIFDDEDVAPKSSVQTHPKFLPCVFFFFSLTLFEKRTRREIPPRKKVSKNCCCFLGRRRRQKTEDSNIIERKKISEKNIYLPQILEPFTRLLKTPRPRAHTP